MSQMEGSRCPVGASSRPALIVSLRDTGPQDKPARPAAWGHPVPGALRRCQHRIQPSKELEEAQGLGPPCRDPCGAFQKLAGEK